MNQHLTKLSVLDGFFSVAFIGFRDSVLDVMNVSPEHHTDRLLNTLTIVLLSMITVTAVFVTDLGVINSVGGGSVAVLMCFVFPALMFEKGIRDLGNVALPMQHLEVKLVIFLTFVGCLIGIAGVVTELKLSVSE